MGDGIEIRVGAKTEDAQAALNKFFESATEGFRKLGSLKGILSDLGPALAGAFSVERMVEFGKGVVDLGEELAKLAEKTGLSVEALSGFQRAAYVVGVGTEQLNISLGLFADKIFMAARQGGLAGQAFKDLGIRLTDANGALRPTNDILREVAEGFSRLPDGPQKAAMALELFGRSGRELIPILNQGAAGIEKLIGKGFTTEEARAAKELSESWRALVQQGRDFGQEITKSVVPALKDTVDLIREFNKDGGPFRDLAKLIAEDFKGWARYIKDVNDSLRVFIAGIKTPEGKLIGPGWTASTAVAAVAAMRAAEVRDKKNANPGLDAEMARLAAVEAALRGEGIGAGAAAGPQAVQPESGALEKLAREQSEAQLRVLESDLKLRDEKEKAAYENGLISLREYYKSRGEIEEEGRREEMAAVQEELDRVALALSKEEPTSTAALALQGEKAKLEAQLQVLGTGLKAALVSLSQEERSQREGTEKEIQRAFAETVKGKIALLDVEEGEELKRIKKTAGTDEDFERLKLQVTQTYAQKRIEVLRQEAEAENAIALSRVSGKLRLLEQDPDLTTLEKKDQQLVLMRQEQALLDQSISQRQASMRSGTLTPEAQILAEKQLLELEQQRAEVTQKIEATSRVGTLGGEFQRVFQQMKEESENIAKHIADLFQNTIGTAIDSISSGLTKVIMGTESWGKALMQIGTTILSTVIEGIIKLALQWVESEIFKATAGKAIAAAQTATLAPIAAAQSLIWAVPATLATIASYGAAAASAPGLISLAEGLVMATAGFLQGGYTGDGPRGEVAGFVHRGEYVVSAPAVQRIGKENLDAMHLGSGGAAGAGPASSSGPSTGAKVTNNNKIDLAVLYDRSEVPPWIRTRDGEAHVVDIMKRNWHRVS